VVQEKEERVRFAGANLGGKIKNKIYFPNLAKWTPLQNWHQPQVHIFSWETCDIFISFHTTETETLSILSPLETNFVWNSCHLTPSAEAEPPNPLYKVASTGYTPEQKLIDVSWTTLYPFPSRECLYKVARPGCTPGKNSIDVGWTIFTFYQLPTKECLYKVAWPGRTPEKN